MIGRSTPGREALNWQTAVGLAGLRGEIGGRYPVPDARVGLCQSRCSDW
jgi:hypothetical protein